MELSFNLPYKVLVVDDNSENIKVIGNILREEGYIIGYAINGKQALDLLKKSSDYDLVLLDVDMPVMNGYDACRAMQKDDILKEIPVIFLTAFTDVENKITGFDAGAQDYITKPYHARELISRVRTHAELKRGREKLKKVNSWLEEMVHSKTLELEKALLEVKRLDRLKTNFLYQISEEIKTPLNGIIGTINLVKNEDRSSAVKEMIEILEISLSRIDSFVTKAVFSTQLNDKNFSLKISPVNVGELIKFSILEQNNGINYKNIKVILNETQELPDLKVDKDLIFKAFNYILDNAVKFSPKDGEIKISAKVEENNIVLSFQDQGKGFSEEELKNFSSPSGENMELSEASTGISLHIVKQIMELHKGMIYISNARNGGAYIQFILNIETR